MRGQYPTRSGCRPCGPEADPVEGWARLYLCGRCRVQVLICRCCDRGQIYCAGGCAQEARHQAQREAGQRYQASRRGRLAHAARSGRWRARQKNVTHQGSPHQLSDAGVPMDVTAAASAPLVAPSSDVDTPSRDESAFWRCRWCGRRCSPLVRIEFLRRRWRGRRRDQTARRTS
jgi:hypothetical protein